MRRAERIREIAKEMGYLPNAAARAARTQRFGHVGLLTRQDVPYLQFNLDKGVEAALSENKLHMLRASISEEALSDPDKAPRLLHELCVDGLTIHYAHQIPDVLIRQIAAYGVPAVWVNTNAEYDCVYPDDRSAGRQATEQMLSHGHRKIVFLDKVATHSNHFKLHHYSGSERAAGYEQAMLNAGLTPVRMQLDVVRPMTRGDVEHAYDDRLAAAAAVLRAHTDTTAFIVGNADDAGCLLLAAERIGRSVPQRLSLATFHDVRTVGTFGPPVSCATVPMAAVGRAAVEMMQQKILAGGRPIPSCAIPFPSIKPYTIAPPPPGD